LYIQRFVGVAWVTGLYIQAMLKLVRVIALYIHGDWAFCPVRFLRFCGFKVRIASPPRRAIRALLLFYAVGGRMGLVYLVEAEGVARFILTRCGRLKTGWKWKGRPHP